MNVALPTSEPHNKQFCLERRSRAVMARLNYVEYSDDELPDLASLLLQAAGPKVGISNSQPTPSGEKSTTAQRSEIGREPKGQQGERSRRFQRPLGNAQPSNSLLLQHRKVGDEPPKTTRNGRTSPRKTQRVTYEVHCSEVEDAIGKHDEDFAEASDGLSDFIVSDSASEAELRRPPRSARNKNQKPLKKQHELKVQFDHDLGSSKENRSRESKLQSTIPTTSNNAVPTSVRNRNTGHAEGQLSDPFLENSGAILNL